MQNILDELRSRFDARVLTTGRSDLLHAELTPERMVPALAWMKSATPFVQLTHMSVTDWIEEDRFQLTYLLTHPGRRSVMVDTYVPRDGFTVESVSALWPQAVTYEQEMNEMFGVTFDDSPRQGDPFILEGWDHMPPMRRDFDTVGYVEQRHPMRPGREHVDPRRYVGEVFGERGYLRD